jgi:hypothetical protein
LIFLILWAAAWAVTALTWERDAAGYSVGMNPGAIPLHVVLPIVLGVLIGARGRPRGGSWRACMIAGVAFGIVEFAVLSVLDVLWLPAAAAEPPFSELVVGGIVGTGIYAVACGVLAPLGGWVGRALLRRQSGPASGGSSRGSEGD